MDPGILFLGMAFVLLLLMFQRTSKQRRELAQVQSQIAPGTEVMTASGLFGTVLEVTDDRVVLQTAPGQQTTWDRRAVARIVTASASAGADVNRESGTAAGDEPSTS